jgi:hypothetical protein
MCYIVPPRLATYQIKVREEKWKNFSGRKIEA